MSAITFLPATFQNYHLFGFKFEIIPDYFIDLFPVTLYFIGSYIAEYKPTLNPAKCGIVSVLILLSETLFCYYLSEYEYAWWLFNNGTALTHIACALLIFLACYNVKSASFLTKPIELISKCSFEMYLLSFSTDNIFYRLLDLPAGIAFILSFITVFAVSLLVRTATVPIGSFLKESALNKSKEDLSEKVSVK
jgi:peptidoglycan/LPS O-acetylase OafA/YrhL